MWQRPEVRLTLERLRRVGLVLLAVVGLLVAMLPSGVAALEGGSSAQVANTDGDGLNLRAAPSTDADVLTAMPEGAVVTVLDTGFYDDSGRAWAQISFDGLEGYSAADFLADPSDVAPPESDDGSGGSGGGELVAGSAAVVSGTGGDGLNVRARPRPHATVVAGLAEGATVMLVDGPVWDGADNGWYKIEAAGIIGWVHAAYLQSFDEAPPAADDTGDPLGDAIVAEAMGYLGTPYLWAGTDPDGFDCSGFTYFIINWVLGNDFPRAMEGQIHSGERVTRGNLRPGDLVFFKNTYKPGLSHVGIYIGNGQFISAGGEFDNVGISNLGDDYWSTRYVTARRIR